MHDSKTIKTIQYFYKLVNQDSNDNVRLFCCNIEIDLAKSILQKFGDVTTRKIGKILLDAYE